MAEIDRVVVKSTPDRRGDWKPLVFLMTDGRPTDDAAAVLRKWNDQYRRRVDLVAVSVGGGADHRLLEQMTEHVLIFNNAAPAAFQRFVKWMSQSIQNQGRSLGVAAASDRLPLAAMDSDVLFGVRDARSRAFAVNLDERVAFFPAKCSKTRAPYLMKYERQNFEIGGEYRLVGALPVTERYFALSGEDPRRAQQQMNTEALDAYPPCPHCSAQNEIGVCDCGGVLCLEGEEDTVLAICPWCETPGEFTPCDHLNLNRGQG